MRLEVGVFSMLYHQKTHVLHVWPIVMNQEPSRLLSRIKVLVPAEYRDTQRVSRFPIKSLILDDAVALTGDYVISLFINVAMSARTFSGRELRHKGRDRTHMKPPLGVDYDSDISHPSWLEE